FLSLAVVLFSVAAGVSWYYQQQQHRAEADSPKSAGHDKGQSPNAADKKPGMPDPMAGKSIILPPINASADQIAKLSKAIQDRHEAISAREEQLKLREKQLDLIHVQITAQQKGFDDTRKGIQVEMALLIEKLKLVEEKFLELDKKKKQIAVEERNFDDKVLRIKESESTNLKKVALMYEGMDAEDAAASIEKLVNKGQIETAASILFLMSTKKSPAVLTEVSKLDPNLAILLIERIKLASPQVQKTKQ
ncbi:MAG: hypothetical protein HYR84_05260, partial [Planctomycetes bacterium]|nr:hypothetical protein [Planctomycetota bacterium]